MFKAFTIKNFRCFHEFTINSLGRVNLITGKNNVGKTALLEAIFLHLGPNNPELLFRVDLFRGIKTLGENVWRGMFYEENIQQSIELSSADTNGIERFLQINLDEPEHSQEVRSSNGNSESSEILLSQTTTVGQKEISYHYGSSEGEKVKSRMWITHDGEIKETKARIEPLPPGIFLSTRMRFPEEDAERFSRLEQAGQEERILNIMQILEPRLRRLAVLVTRKQPMIGGDIGIGQLVPLQLMGEGMVRLLSIILSIAHAPHGYVLIDEIENGIHHSVMVDVWRAIADAAKRFDTQVFSTTHSWDCIRAAHQAFKDTNEEDFILYRLDRMKNTILPVIYDQETLQAALIAELEVR